MQNQSERDHTHRLLGIIRAIGHGQQEHRDDLEMSQCIVHTWTGIAKNENQYQINQIAQDYSCQRGKKEG
jgi:hypothetical protein